MTITTHLPQTQIIIDIHNLKLQPVFMLHTGHDDLGWFTQEAYCELVL